MSLIVKKIYFKIIVFFNINLVGRIKYLNLGHVLNREISHLDSRNLILWSEH